MKGHMKKLLIGLGLVALLAGCASNRESGMGGTSDTYETDSTYNSSNQFNNNATHGTGSSWDTENTFGHGSYWY